MSDKNPSMPLLKPTKVRRKKVIISLKWLKVHHCGYQHITINEDNLCWMNDSEEYEIKIPEYTHCYKAKNSLNNA